jgi:two-component system sensor histidine kinase/response regulator
MGGEVGIDSELGESSTFWFTLRLEKCLAPQRKPMLSADLKDKRVLVVDDNPSARMALGGLLTSVSFRVDEAASGQDGLNAIVRADLQGASFEVVFLDWQMPGMDGNETARRIQALTLNCRPRLIMVTAFGREEVIKRAHDAGIEDVLVKPVSPSVLFDSVARILGSVEAGLAPPVAALGQGESYEQLASIAGARILLVEDNELNQEVARELRAMQVWWLTWPKTVRLRWSGSAVPPTIWSSWTCRCRSWTAWRQPGRFASSHSSTRFRWLP